jgi:hypothetical protein
VGDGDDLGDSYGLGDSDGFGDADGLGEDVVKGSFDDVGFTYEVGDGRARVVDEKGTIRPSSIRTGPLQ